MNAKPLFALSLLANAGLVGALVYLGQQRAPAPTADAATVAGAATNAAVTKAGHARTQTAGTTNVVVKSFNWETVESPDYKEYIANLRSIGCPEETIHDIIIADVNKLFEDRKKALKKPFKFWATGMANMMGGGMDEQTSAQFRDLAAEKKALIRELLGIELNDIASMAAGVNPYEHLLGFLPLEKQSKVMELYQDFAAKQSSLVEAAGSLDGEDMKKMEELQKEMEGEVAKMLTPEEFENYQLTMSQTAMMMRMSLTGFEPDEQEFRELFKLQKAFDDEFGQYGVGGDADEMKKRTEATEALRKQMKATLGEQRYSDYARETDWQFKNLSKAAERAGLPKDSAIKVWDMQALAQKEAAQLYGNASLDAEKRKAAIQEIRAELERSAAAVLGEEAFEKFKKTYGGLGGAMPSGD
jgi:hypothetical protein